MGLNRMMFIKKSAGSGGDIGDNAFIMTMGRQSGQMSMVILDIAN